MARQLKICWGIGFWLSLSACLPAAPPGLSQGDLEAIQAVSDSFVVLMNARDLDRLAGLYTEDAFFMPPNAPPARGRNAIRQAFEEFPGMAEFSLTNQSIEGRGDLAYVIGQAVFRFAVEGSATDTGKYIEIRRREADGVWRLAADIFNSNLPPPPPQPAAPARRR